MKKLLLPLLVLLGLTYLGLKGAAMFFTKQAVEVLREKNVEDVALSYDWVSVGLDGVIELSGVRLTLFKLKRAMAIETVSISFDSIIDALYGMQEFADGNTGRLRRLMLVNASGSLSGRDPEQWLAQEVDPVFAVPLALYGCGEYSRVSPEVLQRMGIQQLVGTLDLQIIAPGQYLLDVETQQMGRWQISMTVQEGEPLQLLKPSEWLLRKFELSYIESGYFRRLSNFCSGLSGQEREAFAAQAARQWRLAMARYGILLGPELEHVYARFLALGGQLNLSLSPSLQTPLRALVTREQENLAERSGLALKLNGEDMESTQIFFQRVQTGVEQAPSTAPERKTEPEPSRDHVKRWTEQSLMPENLQRHVGFPVRLSMLDGKQLEGRLLEIGQHELNISQRVGSGEISFAVSLDGIAGLAVYR
jgi:hypothetical protein